jgi:hypothetical protein
MRARRGALFGASLLILSFLCIGVLVCQAQDQTDYDFGDYDYPAETGGDDQQDDYGYYGDDDMQYYDYHGYYPEDYEGYSGYDDDDYEEYQDCTFDAKGKPQLANGTTDCPVKISGVDKQAGKLAGGIDGVYLFTSCYNGKPMYRRKNTTKTLTEPRVLWYSAQFGDWDISKGSEPNDKEIIVYGGEREFAILPLLVSVWNLNKNTPGAKDDAAKYEVVKAQLVCADGTKLKKEDLQRLRTTAQARQTTGPMLTNEELDKKYKQVFDAGKRPEPNPAVGFTFVVLLVMIGLTIVLAIPYFLVRKKTDGKASISTSFTQMLQQSKKKQSGHAN